MLAVSVTDAPLCICNCGQPAQPDKQWAVGCWSKFSMSQRQKLKSEARFAANSDELTFGCKLHPEFRTTDRAESKRHFRSVELHPPVEKKSKPKPPSITARLSSLAEAAQERRTAEPRVVKPKPPPAEPALCACECGERVGRPGARYIQGHYARSPEGKAKLQAGRERATRVRDETTGRFVPA